MHYEINVTRFVNGRNVHWFATHERSMRDEASAAELARAFRAMPDVNDVTVSRIETIGHPTSL